MKKSISSLLGIVVLAALAGGCATAKPEAMVPTDFKIEKKHAASAVVSKPSAADAAAKWTTQIQAGNFLEAVSLAIQKSGLFAAVLTTSGADYELEVTKVRGDEPAMGFNMTVDLVTRWVLKRKSSGEVVFQGNISTTHTAGMGEAFAGGTRLRLANEGAAKANIKEGLRRLSQLGL